MPLLRHTLLAMACLITPPLAANSLPSLGDASSAIVSPEQEHILGRAWLSQLRGQVGLLADPLLKEYVEQTVYKLAETSEVRDRRLEFILLDSDQLNAFAAPGGIIGVNGGLFLHAQTEGEYASVLAHELAHLSQRHFARGIEASQQMQIPMMAAMLAGAIAAAAGAGEAGMAAMTASQGLAYQAQTRFSRQNEQEADRIGLLNLARAGYDPRSMPQMFNRLLRLYRYEQTPPEFLMTHPLTDSRVADTRNRADQMPRGETDSLRFQIMKARMQIHFEDSPGVSSKRFRSLLKNDPSSMAARYGLALALLKEGGQAANAEETLAPLLKAYPRSIPLNLLAVDIAITRNQLDTASRLLDRLQSRYPSSYPVQQSRANLLLKQGDEQQAMRMLNTLASERPKDPHIWYQVAEVRGLAGDIPGVHEARAEYFALTGQYEAAFEQLGYAKRRAPNFQFAARMDARLNELQAEKQMVDEMFR